MIRLRRLIQSFKYAGKGLFKVIKEEQNIRIQLVIAGVALVLAIFFRISRVELALLISMIGLVILMEIANSAVERIADVLKPRINTYVKEIKDIAASAVMLASLIAVVVGIIIFFPYIFP